MRCILFHLDSVLRCVLIYNPLQRLISHKGRQGIITVKKNPTKCIENDECDICRGPNRNQDPRRACASQLHTHKYTTVLLLRNRIQFHKKVNGLFAVNTKNSQKSEKQFQDIYIYIKQCNLTRVKNKVRKQSARQRKPYFPKTRLSFEL